MPPKFGPALGSVLLSALIPLASGADVSNGRTLYDTRCLECHEGSPYGRQEPKAKTFDAVKFQVKLWDSIAGVRLWSKEEIDDVIAYLNTAFYHY